MKYIEAPEGIEGGKGDETKLVRRQSIVGGAVTLLSFVALIGLPFLDRRNIGVFIDNPAIRWLGVILTSFGYASIFLFGLSLLFRTWVGLIAGGVLLAMLLFRIKDEELLLQKEFGQEWEQYCRISWRLMPRIY